MEKNVYRSVFLLNPAGLLLALCFFFPAVGTGSCTIHPYNVPLLAGPYLFGLTVFLSTFKAIAKKIHLIHWIVGILCSFSLSLFLNWDVFTNLRPHACFLIFTLLWLVFFIGLLFTFRRRIPPTLRTARTTWLTAGLCVLWFAYWAFKDEPRYGLWLSLLSSFFILLGGLLKEREEKKL